MGNCMIYPPKLEQMKRERVLKKMSAGGYRPASVASTNSLQRDRHIVLPYQGTNSSFTRQPIGSQETQVKMVPDPNYLPLDTTQFEIETLKLDTTGVSSRASSFRQPSSSGGRYIKRYRTEEEKLIDIIQERETMVRSAIKQGQQLRAKCNRYKEELDSLKALGDVDMTDVEWRRRYDELDNKYRTLKEELDIMGARNKNGRDYLQQQDETIQFLNAELQREKIEKARILSNSMGSLTSVGVKDRKGKLAITQLQVDKHLLEERVNDLTVRNARGKEYLAKLEAEKRDQEVMLTNMKTQLLNEKEEKENLLAKVHIISANQENLTATENDLPVYAKVNKTTKVASPGRNEIIETIVAVERSSPDAEAQMNHNHDAASIGFETTPVDARETTRETYYEPVDPYEEVEVIRTEMVANESMGQGGMEAGSSPRSDTTSQINEANDTESERSDSPTELVQDSPTELVKVEDIRLSEQEPIWDTVPESNTIEISTQF